MSDLTMLSEEQCVLKLRLKAHRKPITSLGFHPDGNQFASGSEDNSIMMWNRAQKGRSYKFLGHSDVVTGVKFSPDGKLLGSCSKDQTVRLWMPSVTAKNTEFKPHTAAIRDLAFSPDNEKMITGANDKSIKLWNVARKQFLSSFIGHRHWIRSIEFCDEGRTIVSCADDKSIRVWDVREATCNHVYQITSKGTPTSISVHRNGSSVAIAMDSGTVRVYDSRAQKLQQHYTLHDKTLSVCWHPTSDYFLTGGADGKMVIVDVMEGRPLYTLRGHDGSVSTVKFSDDGEYFASGGSDQYVLVWETNFIK